MRRITSTAFVVDEQGRDSNRTVNTEIKKIDGVPHGSEARVLALHPHAKHTVVRLWRNIPQSII